LDVAKPANDFEMNAPIKRMVSIGEMCRFRKRSFEEEADRLHQKFLKAFRDAQAIIKAYPNGGMPLVVSKRVYELTAEMVEYSKMYLFFQIELDKMGVF
jgi:hypothetical protein